MAETKTIAKISVVTDTEQAHDKIGDTHGGFIDISELRNHVERYGHKGLVLTLSAMSAAVWEMFREVNKERAFKEGNQDNVGS